MVESVIVWKRGKLEWGEEVKFFVDEIFRGEGEGFVCKLEDGDILMLSWEEGEIWWNVIKCW